MKTDSEYLTCERKSIFGLLMISAGIMGAYTFNLRGGVFCNAQTGNLVMMSIAFGNGDFGKGIYYFIPITAYFAGAFVSELLPSPLKKKGFLRWDTDLIAIEALVLFLVGFVPLSWPDHLVQVTINFLASMQYNTFRQAEGIPMATTFCTNHVRQVGINCAKLVLKKDTDSARRRIPVHLTMLLCFMAGGSALTFLCGALQEKSIWLALLPLGIALFRLVRADLGYEHTKLNEKPRGH